MGSSQQRADVGIGPYGGGDEERAVEDAGPYGGSGRRVRRGVVTPPYGVQREECPAAARRGRRALRGAAQVVHSSGPMWASAPTGAGAKDGPSGTPTPAGAGTKAGTAGRGHRERGEILQFPWVCLLFFLRQTIIMKKNRKC